MSTPKLIIIIAAIIGASYVGIELYKDYNSPMNQCVRSKPVLATTDMHIQKCAAYTGGYSRRR